MTRAQPAANLASQPVARIGIVVRDATEAARSFADVFGISTSPVQTLATVECGSSGARRPVPLKTASWRHENDITIELLEPVGGPSPFAEALERQRGNAVHHLTFDVASRMNEVKRLLLEKGGRETCGTKDGTNSFIDFSEKIGLVVHLTGK
jgi:hypothetical protein